MNGVTRISSVLVWGVVAVGVQDPIKDCVIKKELDENSKIQKVAAFRRPTERFSISARCPTRALALRYQKLAVLVPVT